MNILSRTATFTRWCLLFISLISVSGCGLLSQQQQQSLQQLQSQAQNTRSQVENRLSANPESLLRDSLQVLDSILEYTENVKADPKRFNHEDIVQYQLKIKIINENIARFSDLKLQADVSFELGAYKLDNLTAYGKHEAESLADKLVAAIEELNTKYPGHKIRLTLKSIGYTDEASITPGKSLEREIIQHLRKQNQPVPKKRKARRVAFNQVLSYFRATTLYQHIISTLRERLPDSLQHVEVSHRVIGRGETLPLGSTPDPAYKRKDTRRRICVVSPFIEVVP